jgi:peptide/nickel transport system ATP-binding protein
VNDAVQRSEVLPNRTNAPESAARALQVDRLRAYYQTHYFGVEREVRAVDDISLHVDRNEIYGLAGESSCGKTTLIRAIARAIRPPLRVLGGTVKYSFLDRDLYEIDEVTLAGIRWSHLSCILQGSMNVLNPVRRVRKSFLDFAYPHMSLSRRAFFETVNRHLERLRLSPDVLSAYPHELSGGMRQRVAIALATVCEPEFIIADEPTTALDVVVQKDVLAMILEAQQQFGSSMIFVTHDLTVHANIAGRLGIMYAGRLVEEGPTAELFHNPLHPYTAHLIASLPRIGDLKPKAALPGAPPSLADPPSGCRFHPRCPLAMDICKQSHPAMTTVAPRRRVACFAVDPKARAAGGSPVSKITAEADSAARLGQ